MGAAPPKAPGCPPLLYLLKVTHTGALQLRLRAEDVPLPGLGRRRGGLGLQSRALRCAGGSFGGGANTFSPSLLSASFGDAQGKAMVGPEQLHYRDALVLGF